jgi:hypothetical protein
MIVSNHQNCLNDPLGILLSLRDRKPYFIIRADVFGYHPLVNKFAYWIGGLPAFRIAYEGEEALKRNKDTFTLSGQKLQNGSTIVMFPEAGHQDKHWLGDFTVGFTKMAFEAAALGNFETDILILPSCNHYSDYFQLQEQMLIKYGVPISLRPFYELYQTKPRTAQRRFSDLVHKQIQDLMLDIRDLDNYEAIDFIRTTYGREFATFHQYDHEKLPDRLSSDRLLVERLERAGENGKKDELANLFADALTLKKGMDEMKIHDALFEQCPSWIAVTGSLLALILLFPAWLFSLWPNAINYVVPTILINRMTDKMFYGSFILIFSILFTIPVFYAVTFFLTWHFTNVWLALIHLLSLPLLGLFAWYYLKFFKRTIKAVRFRLNFRTQKMKDLRELRKEITGKLDELIKYG